MWDICYHCLPRFHPDVSWRVPSSHPCDLGRTDYTLYSRARPVRALHPRQHWLVQELHMTPNRQSEVQFQKPGWHHRGFVLFLLSCWEGRIWAGPPPGREAHRRRLSRAVEKWEQFLKTPVQPGTRAFLKPASPGLLRNVNQQITFWI